MYLKKNAINKKKQVGDEVRLLRVIEIAVCICLFSLNSLWPNRIFLIILLS